MVEIFENQKGEKQQYKIVKYPMKKLRHFIKNGGIERLNNSKSDIYYWFNSYKNGDWQTGGFWHLPCEPDNSFPDYLYNINTDKLYKLKN